MQNQNSEHPAQVALLYHAPTYDGPMTPVAIGVNGKAVPFDQAGVTLAGPGLTLAGKSLTVNGAPYRWERTCGDRKAHGGGHEFGHLYRLAIGWQVLITDGAGTTPELKHPQADKAKASAIARQIVTENLANYGTPLQAALVWQHGDTLSAPVATLDGHDHTRHHALESILASRWLAWDWEQKEEVEPTPMASTSDVASSDEKETNQPHSTTTAAETQPSGSPPPGEGLAEGEAADHDVTLTVRRRG